MLCNAMGRHRLRVCAPVALAIALCTSQLSFAAAVAIETVPIGNPGNAADTLVKNDGTSGYGTVDYSFAIGKTEVTASQYAAFLNAVAPSQSQLQLVLYNPGSQIIRSGAEGSYVFHVAAGRENEPVGGIDPFNAMRFANWLHNGQGGPDTINDGAYTLLGNSPIPSNAGSITRNANATWWIPNENEWYKAAYYNPEDGTYFHYPTSSNAPPAGEMPPGGANSANYASAVGQVLDVGSYAASLSPYGTLDQGGNVWEWGESHLGDIGRQEFLIQGGSIYSTAADLAASQRIGHHWAYSSATPFIGFRVATVPEPSSWLLACLACASLCAFRRQR